MDILWVSDGYVSTGFGRVAHSIIERMIRKKGYDIDHIALNYTGVPHNLEWKLYPAAIGGDIYGVSQLKRFVQLKNYDLIFLFNDMPVIDMYLREIRDLIDKSRTKVVVYFPVDSMFPNKEWFTHYDIVDEIITYTEFGKREVERVLKNRKIDIIYHGVDKNIFFNVDKREAIEKIFGEKMVKELEKPLIILNANRNQPRKLVYLTIGGFAKFVNLFNLAPSDVRLYLHMGVVDAGVNILKLSEIYGINDYLLLTSVSKAHPYVEDKTLNYIYNIADAGINTSAGEGFGLFPVEHAILGKPQVISDNSVAKELFKDQAYYIECPVKDWSTLLTVLFMRPTEATVARALIELYMDGNKKDASHLFQDKKFDWDYITDQFIEVFER